MSGSAAEVQEHADAILELLGVRMRAGQLVIHFGDGRVQKCETNTVHKPQTPSVPAPPRSPLDNAGRSGAS